LKQSLYGLKSVNTYLVSFKFMSLLCSIQVKIPCCPLLEVSASGAVATDNGGVLGRYKQVGEYNGFQHYQVYGYTVAEFLDVIGIKVLRVFLLTIHSYLY
jgi:hypothetical protein